MGGHSDHVMAGNPANIQEDDSTISHRVRSIELIKHNPQAFYLSFWDINNHYEIVGGAKTMAFAVIGGWISVAYFLGAQKTRPYNAYVNLHQGFGRFVFGSMLGGAFGYNKFGDRQRLHNAWVAERLRRRYPESKMLSTKDLWQYKGVEAGQEYYRWK